MFDASGLAHDLTRMPDAWWSVHQGPFHDGGWESISLWAPRGDLREQRSTGGPLEPTEALGRCPTVRAVLEAMPAERNRVRFMRLRAGARILRHSDPIETISPRLLRLHVPILTSPDVHFAVHDIRIQMKPGEVWHVDVRFEHEVHNAGTTDRVHLVVDLIGNAATDDWLQRSESVGQARLVEYFLKQGIGPAMGRT
jgi:hypothetical protein